MARQALKLHGKVDEFFYLRVGIVKLLELRRSLKRPFERDTKRIRNELGDLVHVAVRDAKRAPYIAHHGFCGHGTEGNDLRHVIRPIFLGNVVDYLLPAFDAEVDVEIRHRDTLRV